MKAKWIFTAGLFSAALVGWIAGYMRIPYLEKNNSFLLGVLLCLAVVMIIGFYMLHKNVLLRKKDHTTYAYNEKYIAGKYSRLWMICVLLIAAGSLLSSIFLYRQNTLLQRQIHAEEQSIKELSAVIESSGSGYLLSYMQSVLQQAENELIKNGGMLSDTLITKIARLSFSFKPVRIYVGEELSGETISPGRGQLLIALLLMDMDSASFSKVKSMVTFAAADLNGISLRGAKLNNADLHGAHFKEADLSGADLHGASLYDAHMYAVVLNDANLSHASLQRADLNWAQLNNASMQWVDMNGAQLKNAQLMGADLYKAKIQWASMQGALLNKAQLRAADLMGTDLQQVNLNQTDLRYADLRMVTMHEAICEQTILDKAIVDSLWFSNGNTWRITGMEAIEKNYTIQNDTADQWKNALFRLQRAKQ